MQLRHRHLLSHACSPAARVAVLVALMLLAMVQAPTDGLAGPGQPPGSTEIRVLHAEGDAPDEVLARTVSFAPAASPLAPRWWLPNENTLTSSWEAAWRWVVERVVQLVLAQGGLIHYAGRAPRL